MKLIEMGGNYICLQM